MAAVQTGYLVLADISGYTSFMAGTELTHSQEIMSDLLNGVVDRLTPPLTLAEIEGDAVFAYAPQERIPRGETLLELIEAAYVAFRNQLVTIQRQTTCTCHACEATRQLDLKFVTHLGQYVEQSVADKRKPVGSDVNLVHRLLKNAVVAATGWRAYALFTEPTLSHIGVQPDDLYQGTESYEHLGEVQTRSLNLQDRYAALVEDRRVALSEDEAHLVLNQDLPAPPSVVWDWLHDPAKRSQWMTGTHWTLGSRAKGRSGIGAENHCAHGNRHAVERTLEWRPFDYFTNESIDGPISFRMTVKLTPTRAGTHLQGFFHIKLPLPEFLARPLGKLFFVKLAGIPNQWQNLVQLLSETNR